MRFYTKRLCCASYSSEHSNSSAVVGRPLTLCWRCVPNRPRHTYVLATYALDVHHSGLKKGSRECYQRHHLVDFRKFLKVIDAAAPDLDAHMVLRQWCPRASSHLVAAWPAKREFTSSSLQPGFLNPHGGAVLHFADGEANSLWGSSQVRRSWRESLSWFNRSRKTGIRSLSCGYPETVDTRRQRILVPPFGPCPNE